MGTAPAIGIDLGTSYSCVSAVVQGTPRVFTDSEGHPLQASVVSFLPNGSVLVGNAAKRRLVIDPENTVVSAKRMIGRLFKSSVVQEMRRRYAYVVKEGNRGMPMIETRNGDVSVPEVSAHVLRRMKRIAAESLGAEPGGVVVTVPANFSDSQRKATRLAGQLAGLDVLRVINEPTAAALAYGFGQDMNKRLVVYDFGGGTLDVTILDVKGDLFEVIATAGDPYLGGDDFDDVLLAEMVEQFLMTHRSDVRENKPAFARLRAAAEHVKIQLSSQDSMSVQVEKLGHGLGGKSLDLEYEITRAEFESRCMEIVQKSFLVCDEALRLAGLHASQVDDVALVGGTTRIPLVRSMVGEYFGSEPKIDLNPDQVVAVGAAIQADALTGPVPGLHEAPLPGQTSDASGAFAKATTAVTAPPFEESAKPLPFGFNAQTTPVQEPAAPPPVPGIVAREDLATLVQAAGDDDLPTAVIPAAANPVARLTLRSQEGAAQGSGAPPPARGRPVLLDVTSHALSIATVGGYAEAIIGRNSPIPIEQQRMFSTARDDQHEVRIRVLQGDSKMAAACTELGQLTLVGLPAGRRGDVEIDVTFEVDTDGILQVRARDTGTGREQRASLSIAGSFDEGEAQALLSRPLAPEADV